MSLMSFGRQRSAAYTWPAFLPRCSSCCHACWPTLRVVQSRPHPSTMRSKHHASYSRVWSSTGPRYWSEVWFPYWPMR